MNTKVRGNFNNKQRCDLFEDVMLNVQYSMSVTRKVWSDLYPIPAIHSHLIPNEVKKMPDADNNENNRPGGGGGDHSRESYSDLTGDQQLHRFCQSWTIKNIASKMNVKLYRPTSVGVSLSSLKARKYKDLTCTLSPLQTQYVACYIRTSTLILIDALNTAERQRQKQSKVKFTLQQITKAHTGSTDSSALSLTPALDRVDD
jgi:hypothetical protein